MNTKVEFLDPTRVRVETGDGDTFILGFASSIIIRLTRNGTDSSQNALLGFLINTIKETSMRHGILSCADSSKIDLIPLIG